MDGKIGGRRRVGGMLITHLRVIQKQWYTTFGLLYMSSSRSRDGEFRIGRK